MKVTEIPNPVQRLKVEFTPQELATSVEFARIVNALCEKVDVDYSLQCESCPLRLFCLDFIGDDHEILESMVGVLNLQSEITGYLVDKIEFEGESEE